MLFNPDKCEHIRTTKKRRIIQTSYTIHSHKFKDTSQARYLGITIDDKLAWNSHTDIVTKRADQATAFLHRNLPTCTKEVKAKCYKFLVHPQLEYADTIWDPHKGQCNQSGSCPETGRQTLLQQQPPNQQCPFNVARARMGGSTNKVPTE